MKPNELPGPYGAAFGFLRRRGPMFYLAGAGFVALIIWSSIVYPQYKKGEDAADQLADVKPVPASTLYWHILGRAIVNAAIVVDSSTPGQTFTIDLVGVNGHDYTNAYEGWQPAKLGMGADNYRPYSLVRYRMTPSPVAMAEVDYQHFRNDHPVAHALSYFGVGALGLAAMFGMAVRADLRHASPRKGRSKFRRAVATGRGTVAASEDDDDTFTVWDDDDPVTASDAAMPPASDDDPDGKPGALRRKKRWDEQ